MMVLITNTTACMKILFTPITRKKLLYDGFFSFRKLNFYSEIAVV